jgi:uncharacterized protein YjiS (DUF1127 family)
MSSTTTTATAAFATAEAAPSFLARAMAALRRHVRERQAIRTLAEFDQRMLRDIGLSRSEIPDAVRLGLPR